MCAMGIILLLDFGTFPKVMIRTTIVSAVFGHISSCFGLFGIAG